MQESKVRRGTAQNWRSIMRKFLGVFRLDEPRLGTFKVPDMLENLEGAWREWQYAKAYFNSVLDPDLIDHAIFYMGATEKKYVYLLKQAKENGINIDQYSLANRVG